MTILMEYHKCYSQDILVARDDLYAPPPAPPLAKLRGVRAHLEAHIEEARAATYIGAFDTRVSKAGWGVACVCKDLGLACKVFYPALKEHEGHPQEYQRRAAAQGAALHGLPGGRTGVLYGQSSALCRAEGGYMLPLGLVVPEAVESAEKECSAILKQYPLGTIVVSVGTGTILSGILLAAEGWDVDVWGITAGMDPGRITARVERNAAGRDYAPYRLHKAGEYYEPSTCGTCPFPAHPTYDLKAWSWLMYNGWRLREPILFWNIGA